MAKLITEEEKREIANTIVNQIGGKALYMLGAKNKTYGVNDKGNVFISFKTMKTAGGKANYVKVIYNAGLDLYNMEFGRIWGYTYKILNTYENVYFEDMRGLIEKETGLYTSL